MPFHPASDVHGESGNTENDEAQIQERSLTTNRLTIDGEIDGAVVCSDLWSAAYREAVENLGEEIDIAILKGKNIEQLLRKLEEIERDVTQESAFLRGVKYLRSLQVPLERFKLALDLASPLANLEPAATTVFGVVRGVTAVSPVHKDHSCINPSGNRRDRSTDACPRRLLSVSQPPTWSLRGKLRKC